MDIRVEPYFLQIESKEITECPYCNNLLKKEIKKVNVCIKDNSPDKPFVSPFESEKPSVWEEQNILHITCDNCSNPKCKKCNDFIFHSKNAVCNNKYLCCKCEFNYKFRNSTPQQRLEYYGIRKLKLLAKRKNIKQYYSYKKYELIEILKPLVTNNDFPIK